MKHGVATAFLAITLSILAGAAQAQAAYTARTANLRAGPGVDYPVVAVLPPGLQLWVQGCVEDYSWCDVVTGSERGWVAASNIQSYYDDVSGYVPLYYGAWLGIATYPFFINDYWGRYYANRPWYPQLNRWARHRPPGRIHPQPDGRPPPRSIAGAPAGQPAWPGRVPAQPHTPPHTRDPQAQPHLPGSVAGQPHWPGAAGAQAQAPVGEPRQPHGTAAPPQRSVMGAPSARHGYGSAGRGHGSGDRPSLPGNERGGAVPGSGGAGEGGGWRGPAWRGH